MRTIKLSIFLAISILLLASCGTSVKVWEGRMEYYLPTGEIQSYPATYTVTKDLYSGQVHENMDVRPQDDTLRLIYGVPHIFYGTERATMPSNSRRVGEDFVRYSYRGAVYKIPKEVWDSCNKSSSSNREFRKKIEDYIVQVKL